MASYLTISCYCGNYRDRTNRKETRPRAFANGIFGSKRQAQARADALAAYFSQTGPDSHVMYFPLEYDIAVRRYDLSV